MPMRLLAFVTATLAVVACSAAAPSAIQRERFEAAHLLALGRPATPAETAALGDDSATLAGMIDTQRARLAREPALATSVASSAALDALGAPAGTQAAGTYVELVHKHLVRLAADRAEYRTVIDRAYQTVLQRTAHDIEYTYWEGREAVPYVILVACIDNWARRNAPGLMFTTGTPGLTITSGHLTTLRLSPAVAHEARTVVGIRRDLHEAAMAAELGYNVIAPGAGRIVSIGGISLVAVGRDR